MSSSRSLTSRKSSKEWGFESDFTSALPQCTRDRRTGRGISEEKQCWLIKHAPKSRLELAMHKKKVEKVFQVLTDSLTQKRHKIIILTGPPGVGKSATVRALAKDMNCSLEEWVNPIMTYEVGVEYESEVSKFKSFMLASSRYNSLFGDQTDQNIVRKPNARKLVLVEELPHFLVRQPQEFWDIVKTYSRTGLYPVILIISDSSNVVKIPPDYLIISFNPVAETFMSRVLKSICQKEKLGEIDVKEIVARSEGDLRNAILSLQFNGTTMDHSAVNGPTKRRKVEQKSKTDNGGKDTTLFFFHALGKILYAKRVEDSKMDCDDATLGRRQLQFVPEQVAEKCAVSGGMFTEYLHHNYIGFQNQIENTLLVTESMCDSDVISSYWTDEKEAFSRLDWYAKSLTGRGVVFSKDESFLPKFMPLCRPVQRDISKTCHELQEKCRDVFALQHMGTNSSFLMDTIPFFKKIGYKARNSEEYSLIHKMCSYKTSTKCGVSLNNTDGVEEEKESHKSSSKSREDADMVISKEMEEEIADFSD